MNSTRVTVDELVEGMQYFIVVPGCSGYSETVRYVGTYSGIYKHIKRVKKLKLDDASTVVVDNGVIIQKTPIEGRFALFDHTYNEYYLLL